MGGEGGESEVKCGEEVDELSCFSGWLVKSPRTTGYHQGSNLGGHPFHQRSHGEEQEGNRSPQC